MSNLKLNLLLAWDWVQEHKWFIEPILFALVIYFSRFIHELAPYYIGAAVIGAWLIHLCITIVRVYLINKKIKKLNLAQLQQWNERQAFLKERSLRLKLKYLNGEPVTIVDNKGTVWRIQSGQTSTIISTAN